MKDLLDYENFHVDQRFQIIYLILINHFFHFLLLFHLLYYFILYDFSVKQPYYFSILSFLFLLALAISVY